PGAGRAFCTGVDLKALAADRFHLEDFVAWEDAMTAMERMDALFIAAINGHCLGGGLQLALVCDYRLASADARLGLPAVKERLIPSMSLYRLPRLIGLARAHELILLGEPISAREAEQIGLVNRVVAPSDFEAELARASHGRACGLSCEDARRVPGDDVARAGRSRGGGGARPARAWPARARPRGHHGPPSPRVDDRRPRRSGRRRHFLRDLSDQLTGRAALPASSRRR